MVELEILTDHVAAITTGWSGGNVGGISLQDYCIAVDTTRNYERGIEFRKSLEAHFDMPVKYVLLTHHHSDHANGLNAFHNAKIISSKQTASKVRSLTKITNFPTELFNDEYFIQDGEFNIEIHHSGGHTSDSSYLYYPKEQVIFAGDLLFEGYLFFAGHKSDPNLWIDVLEHFKKLKPKMIVPGHGPVLYKISDLEKHINLMKRFRQAIREAVENKQNPRTMETPEFIYAVSDRLPPVELEKWFRRTAISWFKRV
ncbi:MAG: MBL fold metallo-hydrolase [Candidatus Thorarchaeota archaeon]